MANTNKPAARDLFVEWANDSGFVAVETAQGEAPTMEPVNRPSPMGSAENYSPTPTRDLFAMMAHESMQNGFNDDSGLWRRII